MPRRDYPPIKECWGRCSQAVGLDFILGDDPEGFDEESVKDLNDYANSLRSLCDLFCPSFPGLGSFHSRYSPKTQSP